MVEESVCHETQTGGCLHLREIGPTGAQESDLPNTHSGSQYELVETIIGSAPVEQLQQRFGQYVAQPIDIDRGAGMIQDTEDVDTQARIPGSLRKDFTAVRTVRNLLDNSEPQALHDWEDLAQDQR